MTDLISVVVPVYNVEKYLRRCLDSICSQTYTNLEIILVDDGSPDNCGAICDEYARKDFRVKVVHQENSGLSAARNAGIDLAKGKYIAFIDSDDWIEKSMLENLHNTCEKENAEISCCGRYQTDGEYVTAQKFMGENKVYSCEEAIKEILLGKSLDVAAWDKLYLATLFEHIRFPVGENNEDIATFYKIVAEADLIAHTGTCEYYYRSRPGSITKMNYREVDRKNIMKDIDEIEAFVSVQYPSIMHALHRYRAYNVYGLLLKYLKSNGKDNSSEYTLLLDMFKENRKYFFSDEMMPKKEKIIAILIWMGLYDPYLKVKQYVIGKR